MRACNALISCIVIALDNPRHDQNSDFARALTITDAIMTGVFTVEMIFKCVCWGAVGKQVLPTRWPPQGHTRLSRGGSPRGSGRTIQLTRLLFTVVGVLSGPASF